jgi:hypothetical protein
MYGDGGVINVWLPKMQDIVELCPDFHADLSSSTAQIGLFDLEEFSAEDSIMSDATQRVALSIPSAPGLFNENAYSEVEYSQEVEFRITNHELLEYVEIEIESTQFERGCWIRNHVRDLDGNFVTGTLNENLDLIVNIPSLAEINNSCRDEFLDGVDALSDEISYTIYVQGLDEFFNSEQYVQLTLSAAESSNIPEAPTPEPSNLPRERRVEITPNLDIDSTQTSEVPQVPLTTSVEKVTQNQVDAKKNELVGWCKKKGIWIYTKSGKLRMCDPEDEIALEMPACTGKKATPTYPWIFRAQRFFSGDLNSKSGVVLHNAIFFYKGLAISGTEKVDDKPCSNGSVFIPMELSKQVYKFAKSKRPLIWVRNA